MNDLRKEIEAWKSVIAQITFGAIEPSNDPHAFLAYINGERSIAKSALAKAFFDRDVLAAEVRAWRRAKYQCDATWDAEEATDTSGALDRAKEAK
jgi:hypothetical protein